jgi:translation elongation factor EF-4
MLVRFPFLRASEHREQEEGKKRPEIAKRSRSMRRARFTRARRMKRVGRVDIPQEAFLAVLRVDE